MIAESQPSFSPDLRGAWLWLARTVWVLIALIAISLFVLGMVAQYERIRVPCIDVPMAYQADCWPTENALNRFGMTWDDLANFYTPIATVASVPLILLGCLVFFRRSDTYVGLLFSFTAVVVGCGAINQHIISDLLNAHPNLTVSILFIGFLGNSAPVLGLCIFPDGHFVPKWSLWVLVLWTLYIFYAYLARVVPPLHNFIWNNIVNEKFMILLISLGMYAIIYRYRHEINPFKRQQIRWFAMAMVTVNLIQVGYQILNSFWRPGFYELFMTMIYEPIWYLSVLFAVVCFGISISLYHALDIDYFINRALVYSLLTASIVGAYVITVGILGTAIQGQGNLILTILTTGLVAVFVQPLRDRLQRGINRLMYGERDDPFTVLSSLGQRLEATIVPEAVLPALTETIAQTLKLPYVAVVRETESGDEVVASDGNMINDLIKFPLAYQGDIIGQLVVSTRSPDEKFASSDLYLLENIAHQAGLALHAVSLTADLRRSRQRLVTAQEEERRRLRRDLHDGLGPNLASQGLKLAAVKQLLGDDPDSAVPLLDQVMEQNKSTVEEVRRLVYGLRPPALDELGLVAAILDHTAGMDGKSTLRIELKEPTEGLPPLSAAVEVAAYRITLEALTNVIHHAEAQYCTIQFKTIKNGANELLQIEIEDDGRGLPSARRAGVGLRSMRERAEEVGGSCIVESVSDGGTRVRAQLPSIDKAEDSTL